MNRPTVFVVDDDAAIRYSLGMLLETEGYSVQTHKSGEDFLAAFDHGSQGCVILDLRMPGMGGLEVQAELTRRGVHLPIIFLSGVGDIPTTVDAMKAGAEDFLTKPTESSVLIGKVRAVVDKAEHLKDLNQESDELRARLNELTDREREILSMAISGQSSKGIAQQLGLSQRTVENHRLRINKKLRTGNLLEFYHRAARCGIELEPPARYN
ncbi:response regulator transcription factor [Parasulfuritortus cantonensis]|uniref:Response regulator transcription factor n=1 Tax=Parasulfuritortus cantonensis TaxID=2528202 RepID=A0A4R1BAI5_9PROT|nr:response regulator [Parasulfuritortus cantonensis]TCJ13928.1 response regulator transcription factor [Parasulfuritortus cantonensis]